MKKNVIYIILIFIFIIIQKNSAEEKKKDVPPIELPEVTIVGKEKELSSKIGEKIENIKHDSDDVLKPLPWGVREKETVFSIVDQKQKMIIPGLKDGKNHLLNISLEGGNYNYYFFEFIHAGQNYNNNYLLNYSYLHDGGERKNSEFVKNKIIFDISQEIFTKQYFNVNGRYISHDIELPGPIDNTFLDSTRHIEDLSVFLNWEKKETQEDYIKIGPFFKEQKFDNLNESSIKENRIIGLEADYAFVYENPIKFLLRLSNNEFFDTTNLSMYEVGMEMDFFKLTDDINLKTGVLYSSYNPIDNQVSPNLEFLYKLSKDFIFDTKIRYKFDIIDFSELYSNNNFASFNNQRLLPEKTRDYQFGFESRLSYDININCHLYEKDITNYIVFDENNNNLWIPINMPEEVKIKGVNFDFNWFILSNLKTSINYTYALSNSENNVLVVPLVPKNNVDFILTYLHDWVNIDVTGEYIDKRYYDKDKKNKADELKDYFLLGAKIYKEFNKNFSGFIKGENLNSMEYEKIKGYPLKEIRYKAGITWKF